MGYRVNKKILYWLLVIDRLLILCYCCVVKVTGKRETTNKTVKSNPQNYSVLRKNR